MARKPTTEKFELPEGTIVLKFAQPNGADERDVDRGVDLARLGGSPTLVRAVGGERAVREAAAIAVDPDGLA
jgi:hypothetical protein